MTVQQNRMFHRYLTGRPYSQDTRENQLSPSCPDSSHSSNVQGTCFTSWEAYLRATHENTLVFNALSLHTFSLLHTTFTNKSHMKYRVQKIEQNYNQIWHGIKANKHVVVNYNFTNTNILSFNICKLGTIWPINKCMQTFQAQPVKSIQYRSQWYKNSACNVVDTSFCTWLINFSPQSQW